MPVPYSGLWVTSLRMILLVWSICLQISVFILNNWIVFDRANGPHFLYLFFSRWASGLFLAITNNAAVNTVEQMPGGTVELSLEIELSSIVYESKGLISKTVIFIIWEFPSVHLIILVSPSTQVHTPTLRSEKRPLFLLRHLSNSHCYSPNTKLI